MNAASFSDRIEPIESGRGWVGSQRLVKATIPQTQRAVLCLQRVTQADTIHKGGQDWREEQPGAACSPINAPQDHEMHAPLWFHSIDKKPSVKADL